MKKFLVSIFSIGTALTSFAQDEGDVVKRERIQRDKSIFVGGGISSVLGNNFGDYSTGINFEAGYLKRLNRVFSIGGSVSYASFKYDPSVIEKAPAQNDFPANFFYDASTDDGYVLNLKGGDLTIISAALNLKVNFVPVKDNSVISVYGFAKPFIASSKRTEVSGVGEYYFYNNGTDAWEADATLNDSWDQSSGYPVLAEQSKITGGIFLGPGIELNPAKPISIFLQASFGYTFPINIVSTRSYSNYIGDYTNAQFPMKDLGFTSINFAGGISFNLD